MKARERSFRRREGNISLTQTERNFYRPKILINPKTGQVIKVESPAEHIDRMELLAKKEQQQPKEFPRIIARLSQLDSIKSLPINSDETHMIRIHINRNTRGEVLLDPDVTVAQLEESILRYRRLVRIPQLKIEEQQRAEGKKHTIKVKTEAIKTTATRKLSRSEQMKKNPISTRNKKKGGGFKLNAIINFSTNEKE